MDGSPACWIALIHQLHVAGEEGGSTTMVAVFLPVLLVGCVLWLSSRDVTRSSYVALGTKKTKGGAGAGNILSHIGVHHTGYHGSHWSPSSGEYCGRYMKSVTHLEVFSEFFHRRSSEKVA
jgi:hypothetical protein